MGTSGQVGVGSNGVGVSGIAMVGMGGGGVGDGCNGSRGGSSLHLSNGRGGNDVMGTSGQVGEGAVGVRVGGVGDSGCGNNRGNNGLDVNVGLGNVAGDFVDVSLGFGGGSDSDIAGGVVDVSQSLRGLHALLRDGAGKSQG